MDLFTDFGDLQIILDIALYALPVAVVFFILVNVMNTRRIKRLGIADRSVDKMIREYAKNVGGVLEWKSAMAIGVRDLYVWRSIQGGKDGMGGFINLLASAGLKIELVPEVEGCTDSIEKSGMTDNRFREIMHRYFERKNGKSSRYESI